MASSRRRTGVMPSIGLATLLVLAMVTAAQSKLLVNGSDCTIRDPLYNVTFDFNALSSDLNHHVTSEESGERFFFNVCDERQPDKNNRTEPGAYVVRAGKKITLGYEPHLQLDDGRLQFSFTGEQCGNGSAHYTLDIILLCSYERTPDALRIIPHTPDQCRYFIFWDTPLACQPLPTGLTNNRCTVRDGTDRHAFNLLPLGGTNHEISLPDGSRFVVSVCKPVRYGHLTMCPPGSGVCLVNGTDYRDYGQAVPDPKVDASGRLVMEMRTQSGCPNSVVVFECAPEDGIETGPIYRGRKDNCTHEFVWRTSAACRDTRPCSVTNPITGTRYDLSLLANRTYTLTSRDNRTYELGVCHIPASSHCPLDAGACEVSAKQSVGLGAISAELQYETTGAPYLLYRSGAVCDAASERRWETRLEFICETDPVEGGRGGAVVPPTVVENGDCQLVVHFETVLVCEPALMACGAYNESTIDQYVDLTPLVDATRNYEAHGGDDRTDGRRYFLNVCRPLVPQYGLSCRGGAAACAATYDGVTGRNETTLGFPDVSLVVAGDTVLMKYLRGDPCPQDPLTNLSTTVTFHCLARAGRGTPALVEIEHGCHYRFDWPTAVICPPERTIPFEPTNCTAHNPSTGSWISLEGAGLAELSLCDKRPVGSVDYRTGALNLHYTVPDAANCSQSNGVKTFNVTVLCAPNAPLDRTASTTCFEIITKQSPKVCAFVGRNATTADEVTTPKPSAIPTEPTGNPTTVLPPGVTDHVPTTTDTIGTKVNPEAGGLGAFGIIMICLTVVSTLSAGTWYMVRQHPERCQQLHSLLLCRGLLKNDFPSTMYSRVDNSETSSLLLNPSNVMSDSDDDMLI